MGGEPQNTVMSAYQWDQTNSIYISNIIHLQCKRLRFDSWAGKIPSRRDKLPIPVILGFPGDTDGKEMPAMWETWARSLGWEESWRRI